MLQVPRGCAWLNYLQPQGSRLLWGWGQVQQRPLSPFLALLRRRGDGFHFLTKGPQWPVLGLGLGHRPPGARKLPSLQKKGEKKKKKSGRSVSSAGAEANRGSGGNQYEGRSEEGPRRARTGFEKVAALSLGGRVPAKPRFWRWTREAED